MDPVRVIEQASNKTQPAAGIVPVETSPNVVVALVPHRIWAKRWNQGCPQDTQNKTGGIIIAILGMVIEWLCTVKGHKQIVYCE